MGKAKKHTPEQIVSILRQIEVANANGKTQPVACREAGITEQTFYRWRKEYGGLKVDQAKRLKELTDQEMTGIAQTFSPSGLSSVLHQDTSPAAARKAADNPGSAPRPVSILGIVHLGAQSEQVGLASVLMLLIAINVVFGILNMLPMIPLDGGHVAIAAYEWVRTKRGQSYYRADITKLFPVAALFIAFLSIFVLSGIFLDITHPLSISGH